MVCMEKNRTDNDNDNAAHYVVYNFSSKEQRDKTMKNGVNKAISMMKAGLRGKCLQKPWIKLLKVETL